MPIQALLGKPVVVNFLISGGKVIAYSWHYSEEKSMNHLRSIMKYHSLSGELRRSPDLEEWLESNLRNVLIEGGSFELPDVMYRMREVYEELLKLRCGETMTYSELSRRTGVRYVDMLKTLMRNPLPGSNSMSPPVDQEGDPDGFLSPGSGGEEKAPRTGEEVLLTPRTLNPLEARITD